MISAMIFTTVPNLLPQEHVNENGYKLFPVCIPRVPRLYTSADVVAEIRPLISDEVY
jgi:hypothetical protein